MDLRDVLRLPFVYIAFQGAVGGLRVRKTCLDILDVKAGERVLDIGCGPAYYLQRLPEIEYFGFDTDRRYIKHAKSRYGHKASFFCEEFDSGYALSLGPFDCVILMGLLHHLDDQSCDATLGLVTSSLTASGRVIALDVAVHDEQSYFERKFAQSDRGKFVRSPTEFESLAATHFARVDGRLISEWWFPSIYWAMTLKAPLGKDR